MRSLESYRGKDFVGVEELAGVAAALAERYRQEPERGNVRMTITQRIVRHYLAEELLGLTSGQSGTSTVFNYGNLLRLLAVKKLLADNWSVVKIREFMSALDITALEQLVNSAFSSTTDFSQQKKSTILPAQSGVIGQPTPLASLVIASAQRAERIGAEWVEIAPGLEIKARRSFRPPRTDQERERLIARFFAVVDKKRAE